MSSLSLGRKAIDYLDSLASFRDFVDISLTYLLIKHKDDSFIVVD